jgi:hypothetical protein
VPCTGAAYDPAVGRRPDHGQAATAP